MTEILFILDGIHTACGHALEAHGEDGCVQPECGCELQRVPGSDVFRTREERDAEEALQAAAAKALAQAEAAAHHAYVSRLKRRARVIVKTRRTETDVTEDVVTILDSLHAAVGWGSGFLTEEEESAWRRLAKALRFDPAALREESA